MDLKKYELLLKIIEFGTLTDTAAALNFTQSGVSYTLSEMEKEWGLTLFSRGKTGVVPTVEGTHLLPFIRSVCDANQRLLEEIDELHGLESGSVTIGTFTSISAHILPSVLKTYQTIYPNIKFSLMHGTYGEIENWIRNCTVDIGFLEDPTGPGIQSIPFGHDRLVVVLPLGHELAKYTSFPTIRLLDEPYIFMMDGVDLRITNMLEKSGKRLNIKLTVKDDYETLAMVESGLGISILPELLLYRTNFNIAVRELDQPLVRQIYVAFRDKNTLSHAAHHFLRTLLKSRWDWELQAPFIRTRSESLDD
jgi:DNA-binding transcriptional LysR family regulator